MKPAASLLFVAAAIAACGKNEPEPTTPDKAEATSGVDAADDVSTPSPVDGGSDASVPGCKGASCERAVFVTSASFAGIGLQTADTQCNAAAQASSLPRIKGRSFKAWISTKAETAAQRVPHSTLRYLKVLATGDVETVAPNWDGLVSGALTSAIDRTETGAVIADPLVWTGTLPNGDRATLNCEDWASGGSGRVGDATKTDIRWTSSMNDDCANAHHIYCFEE